MDLADNMKAIEYFKFMINEQNVSPEEAFAEAIDFVAINSNIAKESYEKGKKDGEIASLKAISSILDEITNVIENDEIQYVIELDIAEDDEEECDCDYCQGVQQILDEYGVKITDLIDKPLNPLNSKVWDKLYDFNERYKQNEHEEEDDEDD